MTGKRQERQQKSGDGLLGNSSSKPRTHLVPTCGLVRGQRHGQAPEVAMQPFSGSPFAATRPPRSPSPEASSTMMPCHVSFACFSSLERQPFSAANEKDSDLTTGCALSVSYTPCNLRDAPHIGKHRSHSLPDFALAATLVRASRATHHICWHGHSWRLMTSQRDALSCLRPHKISTGFRTTQMPTYLHAPIQLNRDSRAIPVSCQPTDVDVAEPLPEGAEPSLDSGLSGFRSASECCGLPGSGADTFPGLVGFCGSPWYGQGPHVDIMTLPLLHGFLVSRKVLV